MTIFNKIIGGNPVAAVDAVGNALDKIFTSDEERAQAAVVMERLRQEPARLQVELNKIEAMHRSIFVAGWRPWIGWICGTGLFNAFLLSPWIEWITGQPGPQVPLDVIMQLVIAMLGMAGLRTYEKMKGAS